MAKKQQNKENQAKAYALRKGHPQAFRRTIADAAGEKIQLVFEPDSPFELSDLERAQCQDLIDGGLIQEVTFDGKGRMRFPNNKLATVDADKLIANLESKIADLAEENAKLRDQLKQGGGDKKDSSKDDKTPESGDQ